MSIPAQDVLNILNTLKCADWWQRRNLIGGLIAHHEDLYIQVIEEWLKNGDDAHLRNVSMEIFRHLGPRSLPSLIRLLKDEDADVRVFSANVLGDIGNEGVLDALMNALKDREVNVRAAAAEALGKIGEVRAVEALAALIGDISWVTMAAIEAIGEIGGTDAMSVLHGCLENEQYRGIACEAIEKTGGASSVYYLLPYLERGGNWELALKAMVGISEREGMRLQPINLMGRIPAIAGLLGSSQEGIRKAALVALIWAEDPAAIPLFIDALDDEDLHEYAVRGLLSLAGNAVPSIIETLRRKEGKNRAVLAKVLSMCGHDGALLTFAGDDDPEVRTEVALAAASLDTPEAREVLSLLNRDTVCEVRDAALSALKKSGKDEPAL